MDTKFESIIPRLLAAYERGRLVPFVGSGLSYPNCHLWPEFVKRLEKAAKIAASEENPSNYDEDDSDALIRQANTAVRKLRARNPDLFAWEVRKALWTKKRNTPPATASLAGIWWPLVLTTNYDDLLLTDFREKQHPRQMDIVGRSAADCQRILTSLNSPSRALLWALQGFFGGPPGSDDGDLHQLKDELVVGHEEYRRVTHRALHFRRAFAEVYRSRQLFFLGSGLKEHYLRDLFNEILEVYGPCVYHHYALVKRGELNPDFMEANFQIKVIEYDDHAQVHKWLDQLGEAIKGERYKTVRWTYACQSQPTLHSVDQKIHLELVRSSLPTHLDENECLAVSAGGKGDDYFFSVPIQGLLDRMGLGGVKPATIEASGRNPQTNMNIGRFKNRPVYAVRARENGDTYSLNAIAAATMDLLDLGAQQGYKCILSQLLAAGGTSSDKEYRAYRIRPFPERFSLVQMISAYGRWRLDHDKKSSPQLSIYLPQPEVYLEISSGRFDVLELLTDPYSLRFWVEIIWPAGRSERHLVDTKYNKIVAAVADRFNIPRQGWEIELIPPARKGDNIFKLEDRDIWANWIVELGVVPGSTMRFRRINR